MGVDTHPKIIVNRFLLSQTFKFIYLVFNTQHCRTKHFHRPLLYY